MAVNGIFGAFCPICGADLIDKCSITIESGGMVCLSLSAPGTPPITAVECQSICVTHIVHPTIYLIFNRRQRRIACATVWAYLQELRNIAAGVKTPMLWRPTIRTPLAEQL